MKKLCFIFILIIPLAYVFAEEKSLEERAREALQEQTAQPEEILTIFERDYVLVKRCRFEMEEIFSYVFYSANSIYLESFAILDPVFLTLGEFGVERVRRSIFTNLINLRYGLRDYLQLDVVIPYIYRHDRMVVVETATEKSIQTANIGDITFSLTWQPVREGRVKPAVLTSLGFKTKTGISPFLIDPVEDIPTGSGYYSLKLGFTFIKSVDPAVIFASLAYAYNIKEAGLDTAVITEQEVYRFQAVDPGDTISASLGISYAITYNFSISFQLLQDYTMDTYIWVNGEKRRSINSSLNLGMFKFNAGWAFSYRTGLNLGVAIGLTEDSPDYALEVRVPIRF